MTITISADDPRSIKALEIAAGASQWLKCHTREGSKAYGVPSQCQPDRYYLVTCDSCDCPDFQRNGLSGSRIGHAGMHTPCKHSDNGLGQCLTPDLTRASTDRECPENEPSIRWWGRRPRPRRSGGVT